VNKQKSPKRTIEDHISNGIPEIQSLFNALRIEIKNLDGNIQEYPTKPYIGYKLLAYRTLFAEIHIQKKKMEIHLRPIDYLSSKLTVNKAPDGHRWTLNLLVDVYSKNDLDDIMTLIKQSYKEVL